MITVDRHNLPNDVDALKAIILQLLDIIDQQQRTMEEQQRIIHEQGQQIERLTHQVQALQRHRYGRRSERVASATSRPEKNDEETIEGHGRRRLPKDLPRHRTVHDVEASQRVCQSCGGLLESMGESISEQLDVKPATFHVVEHIRCKYACRRCQANVIIAPMPAQPIDKGLATPGVLAAVMVDKYQDHMPLYRQAQRFQRIGIPLSRSTLCGWVMASARLLAPLVNRMKEQALIPCGHVFGDDTPIRVLERSEDQGKQGRFWIYTSKGKESCPACTVYQYTPTREGKGPLSFLQDFQGYFQADAFTGFDKLYQDKGQGASIVEIACWAHVRRRFYESAQGTPKDSLAHKGLAFVQALYRIEALARKQNLTPDETKAWRHEQAAPVLARFHAWLCYQQARILPRSPLGEAIAYTLNHWQALNNYLLEGYLEIDNNRSERGIRPLAVGRKNYLFVGNDAGGEAAAVIYSLLETCKQHNVNGWAYLKDVLTRISTHPNSKIDELLPYSWKPLQDNALPPPEHKQAA
jgi:transposase